MDELLKLVSFLDKIDTGGKYNVTLGVTSGNLTCAVSLKTDAEKVLQASVKLSELAALIGEIL